MHLLRPAHRHLLFAHPGRDRRGAAGAHHAWQRENRPEQRPLKTRLSQGAQQPVARDQHLNQRPEQHAEHRRFPDGKEVNHRVVPRRLQRVSVGLGENGFTDTVGFRSGEGFPVVWLPFDEPQADNHDEKEKRGLPPLKW